MSKAKPCIIKLPVDAKPFKNTVVSIENDKERTVIWLEMSDHGYQVRKIKEFKGKYRH